MLRRRVLQPADPAVRPNPRPGGEGVLQALLLQLTRHDDRRVRRWASALLRGQAMAGADRQGLAERAGERLAKAGA